MVGPRSDRPDCLSEAELGQNGNLYAGEVRLVGRRAISSTTPRRSVPRTERPCVGLSRPGRRAAGPTTVPVDSVVREGRQLEADIRPELYRLADDPGRPVDRFGEGGEARAQAERLHGQLLAFLEREGMRSDRVDHHRTLPL